MRFRRVPSQAPRTLGFQVPPPPAVDILIDPHPGGSQLAAELHGALAGRVLPYTGSELDGIRAAMPLPEHYSRPNPAFDNWALLFPRSLPGAQHRLRPRDGARRYPRQVDLHPDKGDSTWNRDRVHGPRVVRAECVRISTQDQASRPCGSATRSM
ncbi:hypothetical protein [Streptomyces sp. NPDC051132]|uniref:hypothetical protein n=1 Tax=unclassified Streptomyces TaxID=2593676 RepID=UPI0034267898